MNSCLILLLLLFCSAGSAAAADMEITPFQTGNQSPLVQIFGLPHDTGTDIVPLGKFHINLSQDLSSNYSVSSNSSEQITLDGEIYRLAFAARYGIAPRWEAGIEIPYLIQGGGFLDSFIINWHNTFGMPQGDRNLAQKNRLNYSYRKDGVQKLRMNKSASEVGDISLTGGHDLYDSSSKVSHYRLALKAAVKLPTGDSSDLRGSGSTDFSLLLCGSMINYSEWGSLGLFGSLGGMVMSESDVLRDQHNPLAGIGTFGLGWGPSSWISFKLQLNSNTPLYRGSSLNEISKSSLMLISGGAVKLPGNYMLDIGISEDVAVATAPDVSFHLGLRKRF